VTRKPQPEDIVIQWDEEPVGAGIATRARHASSSAVMSAEEAILYLGLDRLARPDNALSDLMERGQLPRRKMRGRLFFLRADLDAYLQRGDRRRGPGRPKGSKNRLKGTIPCSSS
jgi:hypothetical protein